MMTKKLAALFFSIAALSIQSSCSMTGGGNSPAASAASSIRVLAFGDEAANFEEEEAD